MKSVSFFTFFTILRQAHASPNQTKERGFLFLLTSALKRACHK
jgi:hypothetical protein